MPKCLHRITGLALIALPAIPAAAQTVDGAEEVPLDKATILVTGERAARSIEQTASSVAVTSGEDLALRVDITDMDQLVELTPNLVLGSGGQGPTIRGQDTSGVLRDLPAFLGGTRPRTTLIVDSRAVSYSEFVFGKQPLWDVERIEIFRSPQTTTQGRNSIAGAIFVETRQPQPEWEARARGILGSQDNSQFSAVLNGPLIDGQLAFRIAGETMRGKSSSELTSRIVGIDPNRDEYDLLRVKLLATPEALPGLRMEAIFQASGSQAPQIEGIRQPYRERRDPMANYGVFRNTGESLTLRSELDLSHGTKLYLNASIGSGDAQRYAPPGLGEAITGNDDRSVELLFGRNTGHLDLVLGASANWMRLEQAINLSTVGLGKGEFRDRQESHGIFGEAGLAIAPGLKLTVGARYQSDRQARAGALVNGSGAIGLDFKRRFESFSPKLSLAYQLGESMTLGFLVQRAANPGGATLSPSSGSLDFFAAEHLWDYELFLRGTLPEASITYSANVFYYDIFDAQRSVFKQIDTPGGPFYLQEIGNVPRSWSRGAELTMGWSPASRLDLSVSIGLLETRMTRTPTDRDPLLGKEFQRSPHFTGTAGLRWRVLDGATLDVTYSRRSGYFSDDANQPALRVGQADTINARFEFAAGSTRIFGFVRNVFDNFHLTSISNTGTLATASSPREFGIGIEQRF